LLLRGAATTVELSVLAMTLAIVAGLFIVLLRLYAILPLQFLAKAYVELIRGTPFLIQLFFIFYCLPQNCIRLNAFFVGVVGLGLMTAGIYFALSYPASIFAHWLETELRYDHR